MRSYKAEGIILRRRNFGEADRFLTIFTKQYGKISVKAKGVRKISSRRSPHVELLNLVSLSLYKGRVNFILTEAETIENYYQIKEKLKTVGLAYHICELVDSLCAENQENQKVFSLLCGVLTNLSEDGNKEVVVSSFEKELLSALGFSSASSFSQFGDTQNFIEEILERKLKAKRILPLFN